MVARRSFESDFDRRLTAFNSSASLEYPEDDAMTSSAFMTELVQLHNGVKRCRLSQKSTKSSSF